MDQLNSHAQLRVSLQASGDREVACHLHLLSTSHCSKHLAQHLAQHLARHVAQHVAQHLSAPLFLPLFLASSLRVPFWCSFKEVWLGDACIEPHSNESRASGCDGQAGGFSRNPLTSYPVVSVVSHKMGHVLGVGWFRCAFSVLSCGGCGSGRRRLGCRREGEGSGVARVSIGPAYVLVYMCNHVHIYIYIDR